MNPVELLVRECEASGIRRRVLLLRSGHPGALGALLERGLEQGLDRVLDALGQHGRLRRYALSPSVVAAWWHGENPAWPGALADLPPGTRAELFDLPRDADALLDALPSEPAAPPAVRGTPLDDAALAAMERGLERADVSRFVRRAPVIAHGASGVRLQWEKRFIHLAELTETLAPGYDALADRARLRILCRSLDVRMLRHLSSMEELSAAGPFAVNLNVSSLSRPEFVRFDGMLPARLRGSVVLVLSPHDVLADPGAFAAARDDVRRRGYRVMLRGVHAGLLPALALDRMALDYVGLRWSRALPAHALQLAGAEIVLGGVDGPCALRWAAREGVTLFAGTPAAPVPLSAPPVPPLRRALDVRVHAP